MTEYPEFLRSLKSLDAHLDVNFGGQSTTERGDLFADFAAKFCACDPQFMRFANIRPNPKRKNDGGVDFFSEVGEDGSQLLGQSKLHITQTLELQSVFTEFEKHELNEKPADGEADLISLMSKGKKHYVVTTLSNLDRIQTTLAGAAGSVAEFYRRLKAEGRVAIIDGPKILERLRQEYKRRFFQPARIELTSDTPWQSFNDVLIGVVSAKNLVRLYHEHGEVLFYENVREFLGYGAVAEESGAASVNDDILETAQKHPEKFLGRNNGISFKAVKVEKISDSVIALSDSSIINGCQTTMCLVKASRASERFGECFVAIKVVIVDQGWDVARSANFQNPIRYIDLLLAEFLRPQELNRLGVETGVSLARAAGNGVDAISVLNESYQRQTSYSEVRQLVIGFFSDSPSNIVSVSHREIREDLVRVFASSDKLKALCFQTLLNLARASRKAAETLFERHGKDPRFQLISRIFKERGVKYRSLFAIVSCCAILEIVVENKRANRDEGAKNLQGTFEKISDLLQQDETLFAEGMKQAILSFVNALRGNEGSEKEMAQRMSSHLKTDFKGKVDQCRLNLIANDKLASAAG